MHADTTAIPTKEALLTELRSDSAVKLFAYLYARWQDERAYEDFSDYVKHVQKQFPTCFIGKKRPFEFRFNASQHVVIVRVNSTSVSYASIAK